MDVKDLINLSLEDFNKLTKKELLDIANIATSAANKRIKALSEQPVTPPIYSELESRNAIKSSMNRAKSDIPKFSTKGLRQSRGLSKIRNFVADVRHFLGLESTTIKGYKQWRSKQEAILPSEVFGNKDNESEFWRGYTRFMEEEHKELNYTSSQVVTWLREKVIGYDDITADRIVQVLNEGDKRGIITSEDDKTWNFNELIPTDGDLPFQS